MTFLCACNFNLFFFPFIPANIGETQYPSRRKYFSLSGKWLNSSLIFTLVLYLYLQMHPACSYVQVLVLQQGRSSILQDFFFPQESCLIWPFLVHFLILFYLSQVMISWGEVSHNIFFPQESDVIDNYFSCDFSVSLSICTHCSASSKYRVFHSARIPQAVFPPGKCSDTIFLCVIFLLLFFSLPV